MHADLTGEILLALSDKLIALSVYGSVALILALETIAPLREQEKPPLVRWLNHGALSFLNQGIQLFAWPLLIVAYANLPFHWPGILNQINATPLFSFAITLLSLEFVGYWWHRLSHKLPWLWRLHAVHHSDTEVDATTSFRHHPVEILLGNFVNLAVILTLGTEPLVALLSSLFSIAIDAFTHGNITLGRLDPWIRYFVVTPDFHRVHHNAEKCFTDSNFSNNFPVFDYLFGTAKLRPTEAQSLVLLGLEYFRGTRESWLDRLLLQPFMTRSVSALVRT